VKFLAAIHCNSIGDVLTVQQPTTPLIALYFDFQAQKLVDVFSTEFKTKVEAGFTALIDSGEQQTVEFSQDFATFTLLFYQIQPELNIVFLSYIKTAYSLLSDEDINKYNLFSLINNSKDAIWCFDKTYRLSAANKTFLQLREDVYGASTYVGDSIFKYASEENIVKWKKHYDEALGGKSVQFVEKRVRRNGETYYAEINITPVYSNDIEHELIGCLGITKDISEKINAQGAIENYTKQLEKFAFKVSHELRHPITNIISLTNLINEPGIDREEMIGLTHLLSTSAIQLDNMLKELILLLRR